MGPVPWGVLTMVVGEHQQPQPHQHLSQLIIATAVLPGSMRHKDEGPAGVKGSGLGRRESTERGLSNTELSGHQQRGQDQIVGEPALSPPGHAVVVATVVLRQVEVDPRSLAEGARRRQPQLPATCEPQRLWASRGSSLWAKLEDESSRQERPRQEGTAGPEGGAGALNPSRLT